MSVPSKAFISVFYIISCRHDGSGWSSAAVVRHLERCCFASAAPDFDSPFRMQAAPDVLQTFLVVLAMVQLSWQR